MESRNKKENFLIRRSDVLTCLDLSDTRFGRLMKAVVRYNIDATAPTDFDAELATMFRFFKTTADSYSAEYQRVCEVNRKAGKASAEKKKAGAKNSTKSTKSTRVENSTNPTTVENPTTVGNSTNPTNPTDMIGYDGIGYDGIGYDKTFSDEKGFLEKPSPVGDEKKSPQKRGFVKPSIDELRTYCDGKGYGFDPEAFIAFYESNGWKVSRNPMRDWKMACVTWQKRFEEDRRRESERRGRHNGAPKVAKDAELIESPFDDIPDEEWTAMGGERRLATIHERYDRPTRTPAP